MENGDITQDHIERGDLEMMVSIAPVIYTTLGSALHFKKAIVDLFGDNVIYKTISPTPLFVVGYNDLSEEKKRKLGERRNVKNNHSRRFTTGSQRPRGSGRKSRR
jgi:hypothetical protein